MMSLTIAEVATVISKGTTPTSVGLTFSTSGVPFIRGENVLGGKVAVSDTSHFISAAAHQTLRRSALQQGDVLITIAGTIGRIGFIGGIGEEANCNQAVAFVRCSPSSIEPEWLCLLLQSPKYQAYFSVLVAGGAIPNVSLQQIGALEIPRISLDEQRKIAAYLRAQLTEVEAARQAALRQAQDIALLRTRLLREMLAALDGVPCKVLGDHAPTTSGTTPPRGTKRYWEPAEIPWVKTGEVAFVSITRTEEAVSQAALAECSLTLLPPKTVLVAMYGQGKTRGQSAILEVAATTNQACLAILPNDTWEPEFLYYWLVASYQDLRDLSEDRGGNQANLNGALLKALEVPAPHHARQLEVVRRIKAALHEMDALAAANLAQRADLERLPQRLLAQAFDHPGDPR